MVAPAIPAGVLAAVATALPGIWFGGGRSASCRCDTAPVAAGRPDDPGGEVGAPVGGVVAAPVGGAVGAPRGGVVAAPVGGAVGAPRGGVVAAPVGGVVAAAVGGIVAPASAPITLPATSSKSTLTLRLPEVDATTAGAGLRSEIRTGAGRDTRTDGVAGGASDEGVRAPAPGCTRAARPSAAGAENVGPTGSTGLSDSRIFSKSSTGACLACQSRSRAWATLLPSRARSGSGGSSRESASAIACAESKR